MPQSIESLLADVPFFEGMEPEALAVLAGCAGNVHFPVGTQIFREGDPADVFYVIRHGSVAIWSWLFPPHLWHFDAHARTTVRATGFDATCLRAKCELDPALGYAFMGRFAQMLIERLQWTRLRLLDVYGSGAAR